MHSKCYYGYIKSNQIACPMCKKSVIDPKYFEASMDMQLASMQMPEEYKDTKMLMLCNDCLTRSLCPFHIMGGKCKQCRSYNTTRIDDDAEVRKFEAQEKAAEEAQKGNDSKKDDGNGDKKEGDGGDDWEDV